MWFNCCKIITPVIYLTFLGFHKSFNKIKSLFFHRLYPGTKLVMAIYTKKKEAFMAEEKEGGQPEGSEEGEAKEGKGKKGGNKKMIIIAAAVLVLVAVGAGAFLFLGGKGKKSGAEHGAEPAAEHGADHGGGHKDGGKSALVSLDPFILNLAEQGRFLKATLQLELSSAELQPVVTDKVPQVRDAIITLVSSKSADALSSAEGKLQLKDDILLRVNIVIGKDAIKNIYFTEFVMQ